MAEDSDQCVTGETMETVSKSFVLLDVPDADEEYLQDYLENTLNKGDVRCLDFHPNVSSRVIVTMEHAINISDAAAIIAGKQFEDREMKVEPVDIRNAVIAEGDQLIEKLTLFFLKLYFQKEFAGGDEIVTACMQLPETAMAVVCFENAEVTKRVLEHEDHEPLPKVGYKIKVNPFYFNFHGFIQYKDRPLYLELEKKIKSAKTSQESQKLHSVPEQNPQGDRQMENVQGLVRSEKRRSKCINTNRKSRPTHQQSSNPRSDTVGATSKAVDDIMRLSVFEVKGLREKVTLEIKNFGNIVDEESNILVCPWVAGKKLTTTSIGQAFIKRYPDLQRKVDKLSFGFKRVDFIELQQNVYVAFVPMESYFVKTGYHAESPSSTPGSYFQTIVNDVLLEASRLYMKSICFPSLGFGQILKYPANYISENFLIGLKNFLRGGAKGLKMITFLATGPEVYERMEQCASKGQSCSMLLPVREVKYQYHCKQP